MTYPPDMTRAVSGILDTVREPDHGSINLRARLDQMRIEWPELYNAFLNLAFIYNVAMPPHRGHYTPEPTVSRVRSRISCMLSFIIGLCCALILHLIVR